jgi:hypothetical protein
MQDRLQGLDCLLHHKAQEDGLKVVYAPIFSMSRELLRRDTKNIRAWLGVKKPEKMRKGSRHKDLEGDEIPLAKLVMQEGEKPGRFLLPHGIILLSGWFGIFMEDNP